MAIAEPAPAKLNLALHVRRRRADGYHDLETLFAFARHGDTVTVELAEEEAFEITGPFAHQLSAPEAPPRRTPGPSCETSDTGPRRSPGRSEAEPSDNLVLCAARAFTARFAPDAHHAIHLAKHLPVASGIGGGSADAAATLKALAHLHGIEDTPALTEIARTLGADVPACLLGRPAFGTGRGDDLQPLAALGDIPALLVNPNVAVSTAAVFAAWDGIDRGPLDPGHWREGRNDLEPPARALAPVVGDVLETLDATGATLARMSGSGATCFALYATPVARDAAAVEVALAHPDWWYLATSLI
ncbi:4-(cytidine 5'-diphospho)-2-C-methyl-D-erythritol kinase [Sphingomonas sp.]|uniref:4-(cytidine 5'-diphospho)-2-C-methyl-D-erythritol kinase n=1 Tax=Sphingomonas sp. TaxID=28214 RepID=UPI0035C7DA0A